ncbi:GatB/YqeY domain-containing protein [Thalassospiraceae bacterium LMO-JJ14]|nr:GatB/YqeY domain-containing protein [Thalassospiraceae bacterium LMO-JJ14]
MLRQQLNDMLKDAMRAKEERKVSTIRLINAALKDRDIQARSKGNTDGIADEEILGLMQSMVKQRRDSIEAYSKGGRPDLAQQEAEEICCIESFLPQQLSDEEQTAAVAEAVAKSGAESIKDMGKVMAYLKENYAGRMDFSKAAGKVKAELGV